MDRVELTHIGGNLWTVERFDVIGRSCGLQQIHTRAAGRTLARIEARKLDPWCRRDELDRYIDELN